MRRGDFLLAIATSRIDHDDYRSPADADLRRTAVPHAGSRIVAEHSFPGDF